MNKLKLFLDYGPIYLMEVLAFLSILSGFMVDDATKTHQHMTMALLGLILAGVWRIRNTIENDK